MRGLCIITLFAHKTYKDDKFGLCGRTFVVYQSSHLIGIQFLIGYRVDSLVIEL